MPYRSCSSALRVSGVSSVLLDQAAERVADAEKEDQALRSRV